MSRKSTKKKTTSDVYFGVNMLLNLKCNYFANSK